MKLQFDRYTKKLLKVNSLYLVSLVLLVAVGIFLLPKKIIEFSSRKIKMNQVRQEIGQLKETETAVNSVNPETIEDLVVAAEALIPSNEDNLSIINALEILSAKTGFRLVSYTSPFSSNTHKEVITVKVDGVGTKKSFDDFMSLYKTGSGRLIRLDEITLFPEGVKASLVLSFLTHRSDPLSPKKALQISSQNLQEIARNAPVPQGDAVLDGFLANPQPFGR